MKATMTEHAGCFGISLEPETMQEMAVLVRFGVDATSELRSSGTDVMADGTCAAYIVTGKRKKAGSAVPKRK